MTLEEAYNQLNLKMGCSEEEVNKKHHDLIFKFHPDFEAGDNERAAKLNAARDLIIEHLQKSRNSSLIVLANELAIIRKQEKEEEAKKEDLRVEAQQIFSNSVKIYKSNQERNRNISVLVGFLTLVFGSFLTFSNSFDAIYIKSNTVLGDSINDNIDSTNLIVLKKAYLKDSNSYKENFYSILKYHYRATPNERVRDSLFFLDSSKTLFKNYFLTLNDLKFLYFNNDKLKEETDSLISIKPNERLQEYKNIFKVFFSFIVFVFGIYAWRIQNGIKKYESKIEDLKQQFENKKRIKNFLQYMLIDIVRNTVFLENEFVQKIDSLLKHNRSYINDSNGNYLDFKQIIFDMQEIGAYDISRLILLKAQEKELIEELSYNDIDDSTTYKVLF